MPSNTSVQIAAVSDVHYGKHSQGMLQPLFAQIAERADVLVLPGDLTDYGLAEEARVLARDLTSAVKIPIVAVLGNHDFESDQADEIAKILADAGVHMLDGDAVEIQGVGFAGVKGFAGGFGRGTLGPWGERAIKQFVQESVNEALKLESALARLKTAHRIAVLHYAPVQSTVEGEPAEIFPWLGSSRLEEPLTRYQVSAVLHGHAHKGTAVGQTTTGIPVYNVSLPVLKATYPDQPAYRLIEVPRESATTTPTTEERRTHGRRSSDREPPATRVAGSRTA
jgi:Icc-related predicted phosphoesterase